jgi:5'-nucleotidase/UDP-sugar diphosphatase
MPRALFLLLCSWLGSFATPASAADLVHLVVLHTNDVHGQALPREEREGERVRTFGGLERVAEYVAAVRAEHVGEDRGVLVLDGGDWFQGTPEGTVDDGVAFVRALCAVGFDAMALGNHEFDLGLPALRRILERAAPPVLCANLRDPRTGERVDWVRPWRVVECAGVRVALVGLIYEGTPFITHPDARALRFTDAAQELTRVRAQLPPEVQLVLPLTHCGLEDDRELARAHPDLPLVVGGHSHTFLRNGAREGGTLLAQAGAKATVVGRVDLFFDRELGRVVEATARLIELDQEPPAERRNPAVAEQVRQLVAAGDAELAEVLGELGGPLVPQTPLASSSVGNWIADSFRTAAGADLGCHNRGGIRKLLAPGPLTRRDLFELLPFPNTLVQFELSGAELQQVLEGSLVGRETVKLELSGAVVELRLADDGRIAAIRATVGGAPLDPERRYTVATNSFLSGGGDRLFEIGRELQVVDTGILLRELLERDLRAAEGPFRPAAEDRYRVREGR